MTEKRKTPSKRKRPAKKKSGRAKSAAPIQKAQAVPMEPRSGPPLSEMDVYLFNEGSHLRLYDKLGAHPCADGSCWFAVWAPGAQAVSVMGDFNGWNRESHPLTPAFESGIWQGRVEDLGPGSTYKYHIVANGGQYTVDKADPFGFRHECPPATGSMVADLDYTWDDAEWMEGRGPRQGLDAPMSIYEVHLGSWRRSPEAGNTLLGYRELAVPLAEYCVEMEFTHVELMPITEHPFYGSWG